MNNNDFQTLREDAIAIARDEIETAIRKCMKAVDLHDTFAYDRSYGKKTVTIYTTKPGIWIGMQGKTVNTMETILKQELGNDYKFEFKEIRGHFMSE